MTETREWSFCVLLPLHWKSLPDFYVGRTTFDDTKNVHNEVIRPALGNIQSLIEILWLTYYVFDPLGFLLHRR